MLNVQVNPNDPLNRTINPVNHKLSVLPPNPAPVCINCSMSPNQCTDGISNQSNYAGKTLNSSCASQPPHSVANFTQNLQANMSLTCSSNNPSTSVLPIHTVSVINPLDIRNPPITHLQHQPENETIQESNQNLPHYQMQCSHHYHSASPNTVGLPHSSESLANPIPSPRAGYCTKSARSSSTCSHFQFHQEDQRQLRTTPSTGACHKPTKNSESCV